MGKTVRDISSHSLFESAKQTERSDATAGKADTDVEKATVHSINSKDPDLAMRLRNARQVVDNVPVVDQEKIDDIKKQLDNGTYSINTRSIVEKLLQTEDLLR